MVSGLQSCNQPILYRSTQYIWRLHPQSSSRISPEFRTGRYCRMLQHLPRRLPNKPIPCIAAASLDLSDRLHLCLPLVKSCDIFYSVCVGSSLSFYQCIHIPSNMATGNLPPTSMISPYFPSFQPLFGDFLK